MRLWTRDRAVDRENHPPTLAQAPLDCFGVLVFCSTNRASDQAIAKSAAFLTHDFRLSRARRERMLRAKNGIQISLNASAKIGLGLGIVWGPRPPHPSSVE
jgi:hypothetical protein